MKHNLLLFSVSVLETHGFLYSALKNPTTANFIFLGLFLLADIVYIILFATKKGRAYLSNSQEDEISFQKTKKWIWIPLILLFGVIGLVIYLVAFFVDINRKKEENKSE